MGRKRLHLTYLPENAKHTWTLTISPTNDELGKIALMIYAAYRATNHYRHTHDQLYTDRPQHAKQYLNQILHEAFRDKRKFHFSFPSS